MTQPKIEVHNLSKTYRAPARREGLKASLQSLARRTYDEVHAYLRKR